MTQMDASVTMPLPPASAPANPGRRLTVTGVHWETYVRLCDDIVRGATRITYDRGRMEIVTLSERHERIKTILARIIEAYADAAGIDAEGLGGVTMRREDLDRGLEPDECYYVANAAVIIGQPEEAELDLSVTPPPDLAIEVDISPPEVAKQPIYAALGVPEIWRYDGRAVTYLVRAADGQYAAVDRSLAFPLLPVEWVNEALAIGLARGQRAAAVEVRRRATGG